MNESGELARLGAMFLICTILANAALVRLDLALNIAVGATRRWIECLAFALVLVLIWRAIQGG